MKTVNAPGQEVGMAIRISSPVCDPGLSARARRTLAWYFTTAWDPADNATPARHYNARRDLNDSIREADLRRARKGWRDGLDPIAGLVIATVWVHRRVALRMLRAAEARLSRRYGGQFVDYLDLDACSRELLNRAQEAVSAIGASAVLAAGTLDETDSGLAGQEWQIARALAGLPTGRPGEGAAGQAVRAHVEALEGYARQVAIADVELARPRGPAAGTGQRREPQAARHHRRQRRGGRADHRPCAVG